MPLDTEEEEAEGELEVIGVVIQSGKLSREEVGFGTRNFEPTPRLEGTQIGAGEPPLSPPGCDCPIAPGYRDCTEITGINLTYDFTATYEGETNCAAYNVTDSHTFEFLRVDRADLVNDGSLTFALFNIFEDGACQLYTSSWHFYPVGIRHDFPIDGGVCTLILDRIYFGASAEGCNGGTYTFHADGGSVTTNRCLCEELFVGEFIDCANCGLLPEPSCPEGYVGVRCGEIYCGLGTGVDPHIDLGSWTPSDVSSLIGVYPPQGDTCTNAHASMTMTITVEIY